MVEQDAEATAWSVNMIDEFSNRRILDFRIVQRCFEIEFDNP
jgi:hypothetical protein